MKMILMGTGTSHGVPVVGCGCEVCASVHAEDKRTRCSAYVESAPRAALEADGAIPFPTTNLLIDCGPDFRFQALRANITRLDAVLITHSHADHAHGLDDLRVFSHTQSDEAPAMHPTPNGTVEATLLARQEARMSSKPLHLAHGAGLPIYTNANTRDDLLFRFSYVFKPSSLGGGLPKLNILCAQKPLKIGAISVVPVPMTHGALASSGWLLRDERSEHAIAYLTDCNFISDESLGILRSASCTIDHLIIDGLRIEPHSSHCSFEQALAYADKIQATHTWLTHFTHNLFHTEIQSYLDEKLGLFPNLKRIVSSGGSVAPAYDGLELYTEEAGRGKVRGER